MLTPLATHGQLDAPKGALPKGDAVKAGGLAKADSAAFDIIPIPFGGRILTAVPCPPTGLLITVLTFLGPRLLVVEPLSTRIYAYGLFLPGNSVLGMHGTIPTSCVYPFVVIPALRVKMIGTSLIPRPF